MASPVLPFSFSTTSWPSWPVAPVTAMVMACMLLDWTEKPAYHGGGPHGNLACKKLNLAMPIERRARAQERRVVPETIARFLREASEFVPLTFKPVPSLLHAFAPARTPSVLRRYEKDADWKLQDRHILSTISSRTSRSGARARPGALKTNADGPWRSFRWLYRL